MKKLGAWVQSNLGASIVGGLVVGIVFWIGSRVVDEVPLDAIASVLGVAVALSIILFSIVFSIVNKTWRGWTWSWLFGLRLLTKKKREALIELGYLRRSIEQNQKDAEMKAAAEKSSVQVKQFIKETLEKSSAKSPPLPPPAPRWTLAEVGKGAGRKRRLQFNNLMPGSIALGVRVEPKGSADAFHWLDEGYWPDLSGKASGDFSITLTDAGAYRGFSLRLSWLDEDRDNQFKDFWFEASETDPDYWENTPF